MEMSDFFKIKKITSLEGISEMYRFLFPALWFEHLIFHTVTFGGYDFLKSFLIENVFIEQEVLLTFIEENSDEHPLQWGKKRLRNSSCSCHICHQ